MAKASDHLRKVQATPIRQGWPTTPASRTLIDEHLVRLDALAHGHSLESGMALATGVVAGRKLLRVPLAAAELDLEFLQGFTAASQCEWLLKQHWLAAAKSFQSSRHAGRPPVAHKKRTGGERRAAHLELPRMSVTLWSMVRQISSSMRSSSLSPNGSSISSAIISRPIMK